MEVKISNLQGFIIAERVKQAEDKIILQDNAIYFNRPDANQAKKKGNVVLNIILRKAVKL